MGLYVILLSLILIACLNVFEVLICAPLHYLRPAAPVMESEQANISTEGITAPLEVRKSIKENVQPAPGVVRMQNHHHQDQRRVFVGPMPERVAVSASGNQGAKPRGDNVLDTRQALQQSDDATSTASSTGTLDDVDQEHTLAFFVAEGGREEDFEGHERGVRQEIRRRLKESRWMPLLSKSESEARHATSNQRWYLLLFSSYRPLIYGIGSETPLRLARTSLVYQQSTSKVWIQQLLKVPQYSVLDGRSWWARRLDRSRLVFFQLRPPGSPVDIYHS